MHAEIYQGELTEGRVARLIESTVSTVRAIDSIEEVVQEAIVCVVRFGGLVISLEKLDLLSIYQWVGKLEIEG